MKNIPLDWTTDKLFLEFAKLGEIEQAYVVDMPKRLNSAILSKTTRTNFGFVVAQEEFLANELIAARTISLSGATLSIEKHKEITTNFSKRRLN